MAANKAIRKLLKRIEDLKIENDSLNYEIYYINERAFREQKRMKAQIENERYEREEEEKRNRYREYDRQDALRSLDKAREWGSKYEEEKALRKLRAL